MSKKEDEELVQGAIEVLLEDPIVEEVEAMLKEIFELEAHTPGPQKGFFMASLTTMHSYTNVIGKLVELRKEMLDIKKRLGPMIVEKKLKNKNIIDRVVNYMEGTDY